MLSRGIVMLALSSSVSSPAFSSKTFIPFKGITLPSAGIYLEYL